MPSHTARAHSTLAATALSIAALSAAAAIAAAILSVAVAATPATVIPVVAIPATTIPATAIQVLNDATENVKEKSCYALESFCENLGPDIVPFLQPLLERLTNLLQTVSPRARVQTPLMRCKPRVHVLPMTATAL